MDSENGNPEVGRGDGSRRRSFWLWPVIAVGVVLTYLLVYPVPIIWLDSHFGLTGYWYSPILEGSIVPLDWLYENSIGYASYIDWLDEILWSS